MKSHYIQIYIFHLRKYRYKESILLLQKYILCYLKKIFKCNVLFCELSLFYEIILYIHIFFFFQFDFFLLYKNFPFLLYVLFFVIFLKGK